MPNYRLTPDEQIERFNKLADIIEERPDQFDMSWWVQIPHEHRGYRHLERLDEIEDYQVDMLAPECKTRACVAGWTVSLWAGELPIDAGGKIEDLGRTLLGLDDDHETSDWLFDAEARHQDADQAAEVLRQLAGQVHDTGSTVGFVDAWVGDDDE